MRLKILGGKFWEVVAEVDDDGCCAVEQELASLGQSPKFASTVTSILALWERIPADGPKQLGTHFYHYVDPKRLIYEFTKGDLRVFCFEANNRIVVCSHVIQKKTQATTARDQKRAKALRDRYFKAEASKNIELIGPDEDDG